MFKNSISRRRFIGGGVAAIGALAAPATISRAQTGGKPFVYAGFGGANQQAQSKAFIEPFERDTGIKVTQVSGVDIAKLKVQIQSGNVEWDIASFPDRLLYTAVSQGLLEKLDYSRIPVANVLPHTVTEYMCGMYTYATQLTYNSAVFGDKAPRNWEEFWDTKTFPGRRGQYADGPYTLEFALLADGVRKEDLYPLDVERALKKLEFFKQTAVWWRQFPQVEQLLLSREIVASQWARGISTFLAGHPIGMSYEGAAIAYGGWVIPKNAKNYDTAIQFIASTLRPERQADCSTRLAYGPVNIKALDLIEPRIADLLPSRPSNFEKGFVFDGKWWGENQAKVVERFNEWRLS